MPAAGAECDQKLCAWSWNVTEFLKTASSRGMEDPIAKLGLISTVGVFPTTRDQLHNVLEKYFLTSSPLGIAKIPLMAQRGNIFFKRGH